MNFILFINFILFGKKAHLRLPIKNIYRFIEKTKSKKTKESSSSLQLLKQKQFDIFQLNNLPETYFVLTFLYEKNN